METMLNVDKINRLLIEPEQHFSNQDFNDIPPSNH